MSQAPHYEVDHCVIGAGPAGLTAAYALSKLEKLCIVLEEENQVGGISKTVEREGWRFDLGGHRFFSKDKTVNELWDEILGPEDFLQRPRLSRILYKGKFFDYPLKPVNALRKLGIAESFLCAISFISCKLRPPRDQSHFEGWVAARFGWRLYRTFFKTYTEKVWGVEATAIQADWAAQRIKSLSLWKAVRDGLTPKFLKRSVITSLIPTFKYPKLGPGMLWEKCAEKIQSSGTEVLLDNRVVEIQKVTDGVLIKTSQAKTVLAKHIYSTMPINALVQSLVPKPPTDIVLSSNLLKHRDFLTVALVFDEASPFPDNWIYIHTPEVRIGRIQNFGSWSPYLVQEGMTCLGLEYFVNSTEEMWSLNDQTIIDLALSELGFLNLISIEKFVRGFVVRVPKAYPVYDEGYSKHVAKLRDFLETSWPEIHPIGRNGMHRYNNQDHSMLTAISTVENIVNGTNHDIWSINLDDDYHEEVKSEAAKGTGRQAPIIRRT